LLLGAAPHAELLRVLNELPAEAFAAVTPYQRPGRGALGRYLPLVQWRSVNQNRVCHGVHVGPGALNHA
jgi:hypothetical protein